MVVMIDDCTQKLKNNLYLLPAIPGNKGGYSLAVKSDIMFFDIKIDDYVVIISNNEKYFPEGKVKSGNILYIYRNSILFRVFNLFSTGHPSYFSGLYLKFMINKYFGKQHFNNIVLGDINYCNIIDYIKYNKITVRLHNLYLKMLLNLKQYNGSTGYFKMYYECIIGSSLEKKLLKLPENKINKFYLICEEEKNYLFNHYSRDYDTLPVKLPIKRNSTKTHNEDFKWDFSLVWFGGLSSHKKFGMNYFIRTIFPQILSLDSSIKLDLYGSGSEYFNNNMLNIKGFGFIENFSFFERKNSIFINPDIIGGGVKIKLYELYNEKTICLSTALGAEGFPYIEKWNELIIGDIGGWPDIIKNIIIKGK